MSERSESRKKYLPILQWMMNNTPYNDLNVNELMTCDEKWFNDYSFPLTLPELFEMVKDLSNEQA